MIPSVDLSEYQGPDAGAAIAAAGIRHAIVRCADPARPGSPIDPFYVSNMAALAAAGVDRDTYVFCRPSLHPADVAADRYDIWARLADPWMLWLDFEGSPGLGPRPLAAWAVDLVHRLEDDHGWAGRVGIYTNRSWWDSHVDISAAELASRPLWVAGYWFGETAPPAPDQWETWTAGVDSTQYVPQIWRDLNATWTIWQFSSAGTLIDGHRLDCNLLDPSMAKTKPPSLPEVLVPQIWIPEEWARETSPGRVEHYELLADGHHLIAWNGAELRDPSHPDQPHPGLLAGPDGLVLNLEDFYGPGPYSGVDGFQHGEFCVVANGAACFKIPTGRPYTPPSFQVDLTEVAQNVTPAVANAVAPIVLPQAVAAYREDLKARLG